MTGSNRRPPACKAGALPAELIPHGTDRSGSSPTRDVVGLVGLEPTTPALSRRCSNQLSYRPDAWRPTKQTATDHTGTQPGVGNGSRRLERYAPTCNTHCCSTTADKSERSGPRRAPRIRTAQWVDIDHLAAIDAPLACLDVSRKEVIQPHLPIRLPCYDFTPVTNPAVVIAPLAVRLTTSGRTRSHGVTGGVYKTRERIHRGKLIRDY
jgi:hypothetical protein